MLVLLIFVVMLAILISTTGKLSFGDSVQSKVDQSMIILGVQNSLKLLV